jgi:hypothetical protein
MSETPLTGIVQKQQYLVVVHDEEHQSRVSASPLFVEQYSELVQRAPRYH